MSLRIRLSRVGAKKQASYRIVVAESNAPRDGKAIAILGHYNPLTDPYTLKLDEERVVSWLKKGAQPSETARGLLNKAGIIAAYEKVRVGAPAKARITTEEAAARREARAKRTEAPRLARPTKREGQEIAAAVPTARRAAATTTKARSGSRTKSAGASKAKAPAASSTRRRSTRSKDD
ncbi:MAG TPA: 30S ribosomal protein S16 [Chloroflexota bacterium]|nr:30S ribosomal protein S16 [Chloroflexota bacterium]